MAEFEITHPDILSPSNKLDDILYAKKHNFSGQLPLENLPDAIQSIIDQLSGKKLLGYELVEEKNLPAGTTSCVFDGLNGDVDEEYLVETNISLVASSGERQLRCYPNNDTGGTYQGSEGLNYDGSKVANSAWTKVLIGRTTHSENGFFIGKTIIHAVSGVVRFFKHEYVYKCTNHSGVADAFTYYNNTSDNITSLVFVPLSGSYSGTIRLWKRLPIE